MARSFNGGSENISIGTYSEGSAGSLSVWVYTNAFSASDLTGIFTRGPVSDFSLYGGLTPAKQFQYFIRDSSNGPVSFVGSSTPSLNIWYNVIMTYDSTNGLKGYVNNVSDGSAASSGNGLLTTSRTCMIGADTAAGGGRVFNGRIADVANWSVILTAGEIAALSNGARPNQIRPASLLGYWPLDGLQSPEPDLSGQGHNGTLTGTALVAGPPLAMFTPRTPIFLPTAAAAATLIRRTISPVGTRTGSRQAWAG